MASAGDSPVTEPLQEPKGKENTFKHITDCLHISVEPVVLLYIMAYASLITLNSEYFVAYYDTLYLGYNSATENMSVTALGKPEAMARATQSASSVAGVTMLIMGVIEVPISYLMGSYSDTVGRRVVLLMPVAGLILASFVELLLMYFKFSSDWFYLTMAIIGVSGGASGLLGIAFAYIVDITSNVTKTKRMLYITLTDIAAMCITQVLTGAILNNAGFVYAMLYVFLLVIIALVYILGILRDSLPVRSAPATLFSAHSLAKFVHMLTRTDGQYRRLKLVVYCYLIVVEAAHVYGLVVVS